MGTRPGLYKVLEFVDHLIKNSTPEAPAWNVEHTMEKKPAKWNYIDGCMMKAILDLFYATGEEKYFAFVKGYIDFYLGEDGEILGYDPQEYNCDNINMGKVLFDLYAASKEEKYEKAIQRLHGQMLTHPRISTGNFWHKKIYPHQVWLDGLYMVQPFMMNFETVFNNNANFHDIFSQFENVVKIMRDEKTGLFYHGYDEKREMFWANSTTGLSKNFWTRSIGWFTMAMVDTLEKMDEQFFHEAERLKKHLKDALDALLKVTEPKTKMFFQVTNAHGQAGNYLETSGSCAIAYSLMKGARLGYLPAHYYSSGKDIFDSIVTHKLEEENFTLKDICLVAGLGGMPGKGDYQPRDGTYEYYISEPRVDNDAKGVAPFLFSYAEVLRAC